jgi:hypothetical protein
MLATYYCKLMATVRCMPNALNSAIVYQAW